MPFSSWGTAAVGAVVEGLFELWFVERKERRGDLGRLELGNAGCWETCYFFAAVCWLEFVAGIPRGVKRECPSEPSPDRKVTLFFPC